MPGQPSSRRVEVKFELRVGQRSIEAQVSVPATPLRPEDLLPVLLAFDDAFVGMVVSQVEEEGRSISCRAGCGACCCQLVPVSETEAFYLAGLVASMPAERQAAIRARFRNALARLREHAILDRLWTSDEIRELADKHRFGMEYFSLRIPCPFLEDQSCGIYPHRPMKCREYLVTSPPSNCASPRPDNIDIVPLPARFSEVLFCFSDGVGNQATRWIPLVLALEWAARHTDAPRPALPGPQMFRNFLTQVAAPPEPESKAGPNGQGG